MTDQTAHSDQPKALRMLATLVSYIFHPVFMPTMMAMVLYKLAPVSFAGITIERFSMMILQFIINTAFFPILIVLLLKGVGFIESIHLKNSKDRIIPLIGTMICYFWMNLVVKNVNYPLIIHVLSLGAFWGIIVLFMINIFFKISMHATAAGGALGIVIVLMIVSPVNMILPFFIALVIAGIVGTARLILSAHKSGQIWLGYIVGIAVQLAAYWYLS